MIKKEFTSTDIDGNEVKDTYYFNITLYELIDLMGKWGVKDIDDNALGAFEKKVEDIAGNGDWQKMLGLFDMMIETAIGVRNENNRLVKPEGIWEQFRASSAYSDLIFEFSKNSEVLETFMSGMLDESVKKNNEEAARAEV